VAAGVQLIEKVFHIQNVNAYHSRLKAWLERLIVWQLSTWTITYVGFNFYIQVKTLTKTIYLKLNNI
jgi:predicted membrane protein